MGNSLTLDKFEEKTTNHCNIYTEIRHKGGNNSFLGISGFEGIPQNFLINLMSWLTLNLLFIILRKKAWNYGRMALLQKEELKWTDMFYGDDDSTASGDSNNQPTDAELAEIPSPTNPLTPSGSQNGVVEVVRLHPPTATPAPNNSRNNNNNSSASVTQIDSNLLVTSDQKSFHVSEIKDSGYFSWIKIVFTLTDQQYREKCGPDCVSYLSFQRHLIFLASIITSCTLLIILPINMHPDKKYVLGFARTTIINLSNKPDGTSYISFLWAHVVLSIVFLFISIGVMRHYSKGLQFMAEDNIDISNTICIIGISREHCREDILRAHISETYPGAEILEVSFAYNISKLQTLEFQRLSAVSAKMYFREYLESDKHDHSKRPTLRPYLCGVMGCCLKSKYCYKCKCRETDAIDYYSKKEEELTKNVEAERQKAVTAPLGIAFITFGSIETAERIVEDYACSARLLLHTPESQYTKDLKSNHWIVKFAPVPEDIYWENLTLDFKMWYVKFIGINFLLAIIVIIFSTPVYIFSLLAGTQMTGANSHPKNKDQSFITSAIVDTLPTGIVWVLGVSLISLVYQSDALIGFWTKTAGNLSEMLKIFFFLTFMVIVLPALGVTSISYFWRAENRLSWSCIFYEENGALFVNYICTSSLTGTAAELMRLPELFLYAVKLCFARSIAEVGAIRKSVLWDFQIGSNYAWMMLHFALFTCFSVIYPLVTPFGLLYLILKHLVDRYNIYFAYAPCKVEKEVHGNAVNFVIMSMFMLQINLLAYVHFHIGRPPNGDRSKAANPELRVLQVFSLLGFSVTAALFLGQVCFNVCADFSPIHHFKNMITDEDEVLEVGRASAVEQLPFTKSKRSLGSKRNTRDGNEFLPLRTTFPPAISTIQVGIGGEIKIVPYSSVNSPLVSGTQNTVRRSQRNSMIVSSNYTGSKKPYGHYIPPLLRPEFHRLALEAQNRRHSQELSEDGNNQENGSANVNVVAKKKK